MSEPLALAHLRRPPGRPRKAPIEEQAAVLVSPPRPRRRLLNLNAAATYLGVSGWTVRDLEAAGVLRRLRIPLPRGGEVRRLLFDVQDLDGLITAWKDAPR